MEFGWIEIAVGIFLVATFGFWVRTFVKFGLLIIATILIALWYS